MPTMLSRIKNQQGQINNMNNNNAFFGDFDDLLNALNNSNNEQNNSQDRDPRMRMGGGRRGGNNGGQKSLLDQYGTDLTNLAKKERLIQLLDVIRKLLESLRS